MATQFFQRSVDGGHGIQYLQVEDGIITRQWYVGLGNHYYTGDGNPELVGQPAKAKRGYGFRKVRSEREYEQLLEESVYTAEEVAV